MSLLLGVSLLWLLASPARAEYQLCNETSYVLDAAIGVTKDGKISTQGWFRVNPGACKVLIKDKLKKQPLYLYTRTPKLYDQVLRKYSGGRQFCISNADFMLSNAEKCSGPAQKKVPFLEIKPETADWTTWLTGETAFKLDSAGWAGVQRLLAMLGYDIGTIDGVNGAQTKRALEDFLTKTKLAVKKKTGTEVFNALFASVLARQDNVGLKICNETRYLIWTAIGGREEKSIVTRGWYKISPGECIRPIRKPLNGQMIFSYSEAVDKNGPAMMEGNIPLVWDGDDKLCTSNSRFTIREQGNCAKRGLNETAFRRIDLGGAKSWTIRYTEP